MDFKSMINKDELVNDFISLVKIDSPSFKEEEVIKYCCKEFETLGLDYEKTPFDNTSNIYAFKKGELDGGLILGAHMDVVQPCIGIKPQVNNGKITSDGTTILGGDNKIAVACIIYALKILNKNKIPHIDIELAFSSAEEAGVYGAKYFDTSKFKYKEGVIFDAGGEMGGIVTGAPTHDVYTITVKGKSAHAGISPDNGDNAIIKAAKIIPLLPYGRIDRQTVSNVGVIRGGKATNIVPDEVVLKGELRSHSNEVLDEYKNKIEKTLKESFKENEYEIDYERQYHHFDIDKKHPLILKISNIMKNIDIEPRPFITGGGSDANVFNKKGLEIINVSCGMMKPHSLEEYVLIEDLIKTTTIILGLLTNN